MVSPTQGSQPATGPSGKTPTIGGGLGSVDPMPGKGQLPDIKTRPPVGEPASQSPGAAAQQQAVQKAAAEISKKLSESFSNFQVSVDSTLKRPVVRVVDANSGALVRQVPAEEAIRIARRLDQLSGVLLKGKA
jgi:flagellar protein FlaG